MPRTLLPQKMYLVFERGLFLGAFRTKDAAVRLRNDRLKAGKPRARIGVYLVKRTR